MRKPASSPVAYNIAARQSILRTLLTNMLRDALKSYYPQALELAGQPRKLSGFAPLGCRFLLKWPSLQELHKARKESVRKFYYAHNCRRMDVIEKRLDTIAQMTPLCRDRALVEPSMLQVKMLARQLLQLGGALKEYDSKIEQLFAQHSDALIWESFPGAGLTTGTTPGLRFWHPALPLPERCRYPTVQRDRAGH